MVDYSKCIVPEYIILQITINCKAPPPFPTVSHPFMERSHVERFYGRPSWAETALHSSVIMLVWVLEGATVALGAAARRSRSLDSAGRRRGMGTAG